MPVIPDGLPPWGNAIASLIVLIGFGITMWKAIDRKASTPSNEAVVLSASMADGPAIRDLIQQLKENRASDEELAACVRTLTETLRGAAEDDRRSRETSDDLRQAIYSLEGAIKTRVFP